MSLQTISAGWPYTAKAVAEFMHLDANVTIWLTFSMQMNIDDKPTNDKWLVKINDVLTEIDSSEWIDEFTIKLNLSNIESEFAYVQVKYDGPDEKLCNKSGKQWEPWGYIQANRITP